MMPEDKIEEKFEKLIDYLKWIAKIARKIFTPEAFNYPFWFPVFEKDERIPRSKISYTDIQKGKFIFPDGIHPIIEVVQDLDLAEYIRGGDKKKLKRNVKLRVIVEDDNSEPERTNIQDITIVDDGTDKNFIKNWEKVFGEEIFLLRSDIILFLVVKNGTLEIRSFSMSKDNLSNNYEKIDLTKWDYDRVKFGVDLLMKGNISPFGNTKIRQHYFLSYLFLYEIKYFLRIYDKFAKNIKRFAHELWIEDMFYARRKFLYINSINLEENKNLLEIWEEKKRLLNEIRTNPDKYLPTLSPKSRWKKYDDCLYGRGSRIYTGLYLITQYHINSKVQFKWEEKICNCIVLKNKSGDEVVIYNMPEALVNYYKGLVDTKDKTTGKIGLVFSWPLGYWNDEYLTFFSINSPFNPYIEKDGNLYIPDEIVELLLDAIEPEPKIAGWIETKAKEDQKALYERLYDVLYELERGELSNDTVYMFDNTGEEETDKRKRMESWKKEWETLTEEIQTYESKIKQQKQEEIEEHKQVQTVEPKEIIEKVKQYLNSEDYKQELVSALQKLLKENPEYKEFVEFVDKYYPSLITQKNVPIEVRRKKEEYWLYDKERVRKRQPLEEGVYLIIHNGYEKIPWGGYWRAIDFITRKEVKESGKEIFYALHMGWEDKTYSIPYVVNGLVYFVNYKDKRYFLTTELPSKLYTYLYCGTAYRVCIWMPEMVLKVIWPIFQKMAEKIKREVLSSVVEEPEQEQKEEKISKAPELQIEEPKVEEKQEAKIDKEQKETTEKPKRRKKKEEISEEQQKEQRDTTEKPRRKKKEEKVEVKTESKETTEEIETEKEEIREQDILEELKDAEVEARVKSKVQVKLPEDMLEELISEKQEKKTTKRNKSRKSKDTDKKGKGKGKRRK